MEEDREYAVLMEDMQYCLHDVRRSNFYANLVHQIQDKPDQIFSNLTATGVVPVVVYGIGSIQYSYAAKFQLSLALLLREVEGINIHKEITICCDDMTVTPSEEKAIKAYGCRLLLMTNGRFRWTVDKSNYTLFFLPFTRPEVLGDLLEMNWCPSRLEKMMILCTSLGFMAKDLDEFVSCSTDGGRPKMTVKKLSYVRDRLRYIWGIKGYTREFEIADCGLSSSIEKSESYNPEEMFEDLCWHVFDVDGVEDMNTLLPSTEICFKWFDSDMSYPYRMDEEDAEELLKLQEDMKITIMELRESEYYRKLRDQLEEEHLLKREISRRLGSEEKMEMVIYALGDLEYDFNSHYQLALALLLREEVDMLKIGEIQVFDPLLTPTDANVIRSFGCTVLSVNEFARRRVEKPTLFFLPFAGFDLVANLLETNWSPSHLENLIILGTSLHVWGKTSPDVVRLEESEAEKLLSNDRLRYIRMIRDWSVEFIIDDGHQWHAFQQICWVFINLHSGIDLNSLLPGFPTISKIQVDHGCAELACDSIR
ncbi:hypothetical protein J5N97_009424 [Dioscorea zingiberensis]|uniref:SRR1-like domain-containing protein n=1 Tax=Dioscorea zingiberensis TaxID=325984 RepID=A0A9D5HLM9_9LILI|nr:hypothetical protein J5N97_009424 [Dioscorea zingiberensis]